MGTIDRAGVCLVSAINTGDYSLHLKLKMRSYRGTDIGKSCFFLCFR